MIELVEKGLVYKSLKKNFLHRLHLPRGGESCGWEETQMPAADGWLGANAAQNFRDSKSKLGSTMSCWVSHIRLGKYDFLFLSSDRVLNNYTSMISCITITWKMRPEYQLSCA